MIRKSMTESGKRAASAKIEIAEMAGEANARAATMIATLKQSLNAEAERLITEIRQSVAELHVGSTVAEKGAEGQEGEITADIEGRSQAEFSSAEQEAQNGLMSAEEGSEFPRQPLL